ncbi:MAG TPA: SCO family protein [Verrucomicrobiae bacterium]|nr:SCO family protein [Verrucomicrobiae bacterium]
MKTMLVKSLLFLCSLCLAHAALAAPDDAGPNVKSYPARGVVIKIAPDRSNVTIHHQAIPGYMMEMTMDFPVKDTNELNGIIPGDEITFTLVVGQNDDWVEHIHRVGHSKEAMTNSMPMSMAMPADMSGGMMPSLLKPGEFLPDYALTTEDGTQVRLSDFRGQAVAFTFFFTRCPLPNYCPRMNNNFKETREILASDPKGPSNWQFISISFDPGFDTPEVLTDYAGAFRGADTNRWLFASASPSVLADAALRLGLVVMRQGSNISHNMRTVVLDPQGRIFKQFNGNLWTPQALADAMTQAARMTH